MEPKEDGFYLTIINAAPELDFLFALARRGTLSLTVAAEGGKKDIDVYIDEIAVPEGERKHAGTDEKNGSGTWFIKGHFWGDGKNSWSQISLGNSLEQQPYYIWGPFVGTYDKTRRKGQIHVLNFIPMHNHRLPANQQT
jgi:hypothetical protein